jgi:multidrug efflux pump subunit AcrA (membrane-fusion protein)
MNPGDHLLAVSDPLATATAFGGMDRPLKRVLAGGATLLTVLQGFWTSRAASRLLAHLGGHTYGVPIDKLTFGQVTKGPCEDFIAVRSTAASFTTAHLTADQGGSVKRELVEDGAEVKAGPPLIVLTNATLQLQVALRQAATAGQINAQGNTKIQLEETRFKHQHDLLDTAHQISKLKDDLPRHKVVHDGNAIASPIYQQDQEAYAYELKLRDATASSGGAEKAVSATLLRQLQDTLIRLKGNSATAAASLGVLTTRAPIDGQLTALTAEVGQSKRQRAVPGQLDSLDRCKLTALVDEYYVGRMPRRRSNCPPDGRYVTRRNVRLGRRNPEHVAVLDGLAPGEKIIVSGYEAFQKIDRDAHRMVNLLDGAIVTENIRQIS